ncbi:hypothetical protein CYMTET_31327, partial [Cymbomonas tetramitiformis]
MILLDSAHGKVLSRYAPNFPPITISEIMSNIKATDAIAYYLQRLGDSSSLELAPRELIPSHHAARRQSFSIEEAVKATPSGLQIPEKTKVYINWVQPSREHFDSVLSACQELLKKGLVPVPHLPASRFKGVADLEAALEELSQSGILDVMIIAGNDCDTA